MIQAMKVLLVSAFYGVGNILGFSQKILENKRDLLALYLSGTYYHKTGTRPPSCVTPQQPTLHTYLVSQKLVTPLPLLA